MEWAGFSSSSSDFIIIDGSQGEGGGQVLRTAISLSAVTGKPVEITNIRAKRPKPGLQPQHVTSVEAVARLFDAKVQGLQAGSSHIRFAPPSSARFMERTLKLDVGTAGSIPMILMTVIPAVSLSGNAASIEITGGTDVMNSPTIDYLRHVVSEAYRSIGIKFRIEVARRGYYPKGGGVVRIGIEACERPGALDLRTAQDIEPRISGVCCQLPKHVAERQISSALLSLEKAGIRCSNYSASFETSSSPGCSVLVYSASDFGPFIGGDSIGAIGKRAEDVGAQAACRFIEAHKAGATVDPFLADMLVIPLSMALGKSRYVIPKATMHLKTNMEVVSQIIKFKYKIDQADNGHIVSIEGQGS